MNNTFMNKINSKRHKRRVHWQFYINNCNSFSFWFVKENEIDEINDDGSVELDDNSKTGM